MICFLFHLIKDQRKMQMTASAPVGQARYLIQQPLGQGGFGVVERALDTQTGAMVAIKTISKEKVHSESKRMLREVDIMIQLREKHPNILTLCDGYISNIDPVDPDRFDLHLVMPLLRGDLHRAIKELSTASSSRTHFTEAAAEGFSYSRLCIVFAYQIAYGLNFLHASGVVHRDLKPDNVLVHVDLANVDYSQAVLADFGISRDIANNATIYVCTRQYRSPEVITNLVTGQPAIDVWAYGAIIFEMVTGGRILFNIPMSARNNAGGWSPVKASHQLECILNIIGTPEDEDIENMPPEHANVKSYLSQTKLQNPRSSQLRMYFDKYFILKCSPEEKEDWFTIIQGCLHFFPSKRMTTEEVLKSSLFQRCNIFFGENVTQLPVVQYVSCGTSDVKRENKAKIRQLLQQTTFQPNLKVRFPEVNTPMLAERYQVLPTATIDDVQAAINLVMVDMQQLGSSSPEMLSELRSVLNYYVALLPVPGSDHKDELVELSPEDDEFH